jgi:predicted Zn finger-like uncharacterized protein
MAIRITCPACKTNNSIDDDLRGRKIRCRECDGVIRVPAGGPQDDEEHRSANRNKRKPAKQGFPIVLAAIVGGAGVLLVLLLLAAGVAALFLLLSEPDAPSGQQAQNDQQPVEGGANNPPAPDNRPPVNAHANVGEDTQFVGNMINPPPARRYADASKRPVIGVLFQTGQWENVKCLSSLVPAYDARQPRHNLQAVLARPGYAVGGLNVKTKKFVAAVQVVFMKQKPDGTPRSGRPVHQQLARLSGGSRGPGNHRRQRAQGDRDEHQVWRRGRCRRLGARLRSISAESRQPALRAGRE